MTVRDALLSMGYREREPGKWLKPIGFHCFTYSEERKELANWFKHVSEDKILCWERKRYEAEDHEEDFFVFLMEWEAYSNIISGSPCPDFRLQIPDLG